LSAKTAKFADGIEGWILFYVPRQNQG